MEFECMECGAEVSLRQAEKQECPECGGSDIDVAG